MSFDRLESSVPMLEMAVSWLSSLVNCVFQGVSTFWRLPTIWATVELTSNPAPLVGDPKFSPTVPIALSLEKLKQPGNQPLPDWVGSLLSAFRKPQKNSPAQSTYRLSRGMALEVAEEGLKSGGICGKATLRG
jgi:hypothetical protein